MRRKVKLQYIKLEKVYKDKPLYFVGINDYHGILFTFNKFEASTYKNNFVGKVDLLINKLCLRANKIQYQIPIIPDSDISDYTYDYEQEYDFTQFTYTIIRELGLTCIEQTYINNLTIENIQE